MECVGFAGLQVQADGTKILLTARCVRFFSKINFNRLRHGHALGRFVRDTVNQQDSIFFGWSEPQQMRTVQIPNVEINAGADDDLRVLVASEAELDDAKMRVVGA